MPSPSCRHIGHSSQSMAMQKMPKPKRQASSLRMQPEHKTETTVALIDKQ